MELKEFIENFTDQFDDLDEGCVIDGDTYFKELECWSSLAGISIIAMIDEEYSVSITGKEIRESETIEDLFNLVKTKQNV